VPTCARSQPFRLACHDTEPNSLRGHSDRIRVREGAVPGPRYGDDDAPVFADLQERERGAGWLDAAHAILVRAGRTLPHAAMMLVPEAWQGNDAMDPEIRACFEYHSTIMEPWDGPAAVAFSNGRQVGAVLDRNGLRPARWLVTHDDLVVLASEAGAL